MRVSLTSAKIETNYEKNVLLVFRCRITSNINKQYGHAHQLAGSIAPSVDEHKLTVYFTNFGKVESCNVVRDRATNISKGFAFVTFLSAQVRSKWLPRTVQTEMCNFNVGWDEVKSSTHLVNSPYVLYFSGGSSRALGEEARAG